MTAQERRGPVPLGQPVLLRAGEVACGGSESWARRYVTAGNTEEAAGAGKPVCDPACSFRACSVCEHVTLCSEDTDTGSLAYIFQRGFSLILPWE